MLQSQLKRRIRRYCAGQRRVVRQSVRTIAPTVSRTTTIVRSTCYFDGFEVTNAAGRYWHIEVPVVSFFATASVLLGRWPRAAEQQDVPAPALFLDLETCGFAGSAIFLVGLLQVTSRGPMLTQLWARNYAEEAAVLQALREVVLTSGSLWTFNGKSFDWPQVRDRTILHRRDPSALPELPHVDLLHGSRRKYRGQFPDCRLQTLERHVCGRHRQGDIPGREIPEVYAEYVRTGNINAIQPILHHNALDLVTLWELASR